MIKNDLYKILNCVNTFSQSLAGERKYFSLLSYQTLKYQHHVENRMKPRLNGERLFFYTIPVEFYLELTKKCNRKDKDAS